MKAPAMLFWGEVALVSNNSCKKDSLPVKTKSKKMHNSLQKLCRSKRVSPGLSASATIEAVAVFSIIILFFISIIWFIELFKIHSAIGSELNSIGTEMVAYSYPYYMLISDEDDEAKQDIFDLAMKVGWTEGYVRNRLMKLPEARKIRGMTTLLSDLSQENEIDIVVTYYAEPIIDIPGINWVIMSNHFFSKCYSGYDGENAQNEEMVFITPQGEVYHTSLSCRVLISTVENISIADVKDKRNEDGAIYYPCEYCSFEGFGETVYITKYGNRYHSKSDCSELKTDIYEIPLSEAGDRRKCKFCSSSE